NVFVIGNKPLRFSHAGAHFPAFGGEAARQGAAEKPGRTGDDDNFALHASVTMPFRPSEVNSRAKSVPTRSAFAISVYVSPFAGRLGKVEPSARVTSGAARNAPCGVQVSSPPSWHMGKQPP